MRMELLTATELAPHISKRETVLVPIGSMEVHGPHLPLGTDTLIVDAIGELLARRTQIVRLPPIWCSIADTTDELPGTIHVPLAESAAYVTAICRGLVRNGFGSVLLLNIHGRNNLYLPAVAAELFEESDIPVLALDAYSCFAEEIDPHLLGPIHNHLKETTLLLGALRVLGLPEPTGLDRLRTIEVQKPDSLRRLLSVGSVGYYHNREVDHIAPREGADAERGVAYLEAVADHLVCVLADLRAYREYVAEHPRRRKAPCAATNGEVAAKHGQGQETFGEGDR